MNKKSDNELIKEFIIGSEVSFEILRRRYDEELILYVVYKFKFSVEEAKDIVANVFFRLYKNKFKGYHFNEKFSNYIKKSIKNESISLTRRLKIISFFRFKEKHNTKSENFREVYDNKEMVEFLINKLQKKDRAIIIFRDFHYMAYKEISEITGININTLRSDYNRAKNKLNDIAKKNNINPEDLL